MRTIATLSVLVCLMGATGGASGQALTPTAPPPVTPTAPTATPSVAPLAPTTAPPVAIVPSPAPSNPQPPPRSQGGGAVVTNLSTFSVGNWSGTAYSAPGSQALDNCAAQVLYKNGITLGFWVDHNYQWGMFLVDPDWKLTSGVSYPITYSIDNSRPANANADASGPTTVLINMPPDQALYRQFEQGSGLTIVAAEKSFEFYLTDTSKLLPELIDCVDYYARSASAPHSPDPNVNPFQSRTTP